MSKWEKKTTNQILNDILVLKETHVSIKDKLIKLYDELVAVEKDFNDANEIIHKRLKGTKDE